MHSPKFVHADLHLQFISLFTASQDMFRILKDVDLRVQTWESVHFRLMYQEKLLQGSCLRRPPEANDIAGVYAVISGGEKNIRKIEKAIFGARFDLFV